MRVVSLLFGCCLGFAAGGPAVASAQSDAPQRRGPPPHAIALADIGRSGLRSLISASGGIGDLQNRAGSYRMAVQLETTRVRSLEGRLAALDAALSEPTLSYDQRLGIERMRDATLTELGTVPDYAADYATATLQVESLLPSGLVGDRPLFVAVRGRGHARGGGSDELVVFTAGVSAGPVLMVSGRWVFGLGLALDRTDVRIGAFDGSSRATSVGPQLNVGCILGQGWSVAAQASHVWSRGRSTILRPGRDDSIRVRSDGRSATTAAKAELTGRFRVAELPGGDVSVRPRVGGFLISSRIAPGTNSLGERGTGPFGARENLAAVRVGATVDAGAGAWTPAISLSWERELDGQMSVLVNDPHAFIASAGFGWSWRRGRRLVLDYTWLRGKAGLRRTSELTLVVLLDG